MSLTKQLAEAAKDGSDSLKCSKEEAMTKITLLKQLLMEGACNINARDEVVLSYVLNEPLINSRLF